MIAARYWPLVFKQVRRNPTRSALTIAGVAAAMFLYVAVQAMQAGAAAATQRSAADTTLVVYRKDRFCPFASRLQQDYGARIARIPGVASVVPMKIVVNNCRTALDVVTFRGVPVDDFITANERHITLLSGSLEDWRRRSDAVLLGETLAKRRGLRAGDQFDAAGVRVFVAGVIRSDEPQHANVAYAQLDFLQRASARGGLGIVTQFNVRVADPQQLDAVAAAIDAEFAHDREPTHTRPEKAFVAQAAADVFEIVGFTRWLGWGCLIAVLALVGNAIVLAVQDRIREHAILQTLGFRAGLVARLIIAESLLLALAGGCAGTLLALTVLWWGQFSLSVDGLSVNAHYDAALLGWGLLIATLLGVLAGLMPAWQAARRDIVTCFRAV